MDLNNLLIYLWIGSLICIESAREQQRWLFPTGQAAEDDNIAPPYLSTGSRADPGSIQVQPTVQINKQLYGAKSSQEHEPGSGPRIETRVRHSPVIARHAYNGKADPKSSQEASLEFDQRHPQPGTGMAVAELKTHTPTTQFRKGLKPPRLS